MYFAFKVCQVDFSPFLFVIHTLFLTRERHLYPLTNIIPEYLKVSCNCTPGVPLQKMPGGGHEAGQGGRWLGEEGCPRPRPGVRGAQEARGQAGAGGQAGGGAGGGDKHRGSGHQAPDIRYYDYSSTDFLITIIQDVPGYPKEELSERDIIMINRGMEIRRQSDHHGFPPLDVARPRPGYQWPSGGYSPAALDRVNICTPPYLRYSPHHTLHPQQTLGQVSSSNLKISFIT